MRISDWSSDVGSSDLAKGLRQAGIPLCIKNTFDPEAPGATIRGDLQAEETAVELITGLKRVYAFEFFEQDMVGVKGYDAAILEALKRHKRSDESRVGQKCVSTRSYRGSQMHKKKKYKKKKKE